MLSKVVTKVATLLEDTPAIGVHALEIQLDTLCLWVPYFDGLVPIWGNPFKGLWDICLFNNFVAVRLIILIQWVNREFLFYIWGIKLLAFSGRVRLFGFWLKNPLNLIGGFSQAILILSTFMPLKAIKLTWNSWDRRSHFCRTSFKERLFAEIEGQTELCWYRPWRGCLIIFLFGLIQLVYQVLDL